MHTSEQEKTLSVQGSVDHSSVGACREIQVRRPRLSLSLFLCMSVGCVCD